jgi:hypothetical protein
MRELSEKKRIELKCEAEHTALQDLYGSIIDESLLRTIECMIRNYFMYLQAMQVIRTVPDIKCNAFTTYGNSVSITYTDPETGEEL